MSKICFSHTHKLKKWNKRPHHVYAQHPRKVCWPLFSFGLSAFIAWEKLPLPNGPRFACVICILERVIAQIFLLGHFSRQIARKIKKGNLEYLKKGFFLRTRSNKDEIIFVFRSASIPSTLSGPFFVVAIRWFDSFHWRRRKCLTGRILKRDFRLNLHEILFFRCSITKGPWWKDKIKAFIQIKRNNLVRWN